MNSLTKDVRDLAVAEDCELLLPTFRPSAERYTFSNGNRTAKSTSMEAYGLWATETIPKNKVSSFSIQLGSKITPVSMIGIAPSRCLGELHPYMDNYTRAFTDNGSIYPNLDGTKYCVATPFKIHDKFTVTVDLKNGKIIYSINKEKKWIDDLPEDYASIEYYPFVYTEDGPGLGVGVEFSFVAY